MNPPPPGWLSFPFIAAIRAYQLTIGPFFAGRCRFDPSCSHYAIGAYRTHGPVRGTWLTARRLLRCHPFCEGGYDPVPAASRSAAPESSPEAAGDQSSRTGA